MKEQINEDILTDKSVNGTSSGNVVTESRQLLREDKLFWYFAGFITLAGIYTLALLIETLLLKK